MIKATRSTHLHGTTRARPHLERQGIAINFSTHILDAYNRAKEAEEKETLVDCKDMDEEEDVI